MGTGKRRAAIALGRRGWWRPNDKKMFFFGLASVFPNRTGDEAAFWMRATVVCGLGLKFDPEIGGLMMIQC